MTTYLTLKDVNFTILCIKQSGSECASLIKKYEEIKEKILLKRDYEYAKQFSQSNTEAIISEMEYI